jgi:hypothetical protein
MYLGRSPRDRPSIRKSTEKQLPSSINVQETYGNDKFVEAEFLRNSVEYLTENS